MSEYEIRLGDHSAEIIEQLGARARIALERIGMQAEAYAKLNITDSMRMGIDLKAQGEKDNSRSGATGLLRNRITHTFVQNGEETAVYIGTNVPYAPYHEFGTGVHATRPGGRKGYWIYVEGQTSRRRGGGKTYSTLKDALKAMAIMRKKGIPAHVTNGIYPLHFLRDAAANHIDEYKQIIEETMRGA